MRRCRTIVAALIGGSLAAAASAAGVNKCLQPSGRIAYSGLLCEAADLPLARDPAPFSVIPAAPPEAAAAKRAAGRGGTAEHSRATVRPPAAVARAAASATKAGERARRAQERRFAALGMTEAEVLARLGRPDRVLGSGGSNGRSGKGTSRWVYLPAEGDSDTITVVEMENGVVSNVQRRISR